MIPYATSIKYMIAGYTVIFILIAIFLISLVIRWRNLKRDLYTLENLDKDQQTS